MRRIFFYLAIFAFSALLLASCEKDDDKYSLGKIWISMGLIDTINTQGYDFIIICDNGDTLLPASNAVPFFKTSNHQRVIANYTKLGDVSGKEQQFYVRINGLSNVLFKNVIEITEANSDSLGNDPVVINDMWIKDDMLNIDFTYAGSGQKTHFINLGYRTNSDGGLDSPVELEFMHNANNDQRQYLLNGIVTFKLAPIKIAGSTSTEFSVNWTDYKGNSHQKTGTYHYPE